ncbi:MAG: glycosyltransferase family 2 protein [Bryobacterales bacterium]|nr:glycosyltransferase family 2 protein [Bryobacterales bacterium]
MALSPQPDVSCIIISLNSRHYLADCIRSIEESVWRGYTHEIIVVDNGSTDGTLEQLAREFPHVRVVANTSNLGYCKAGNQGAEVSAGRYYLLLNDDILIVDDALPKIIEFMDANPKAGMIGSRLLNIDGTDQFSSGRSFTTPMNALFSRKSMFTRLFPNAVWARNYLMSDRITGTEPYEVDWLSAAAMMARPEAFRESGELVEDYYYFHEQIICKRMLACGWKIYLHPQSKILHYEGAGSGARTARVRRAHVKKFHIAAYKWYCMHLEISRWNPVRLLIGALLGGRATLLMIHETVRTDPRANEAQAGRPEGGIPLG